jgi:hypothetical protein
VFDRREASFTEKQCLDWVKSMAPRPEPEAPPDLDDSDADSDGAWSQKRLRRLFAHPGAAAAHHAAPGGPKTAVAHGR